MRAKSSATITNLIINDRKFNKSHICNKNNSVRQYRKSRFIRQGNKFMKIENKTITFIVYKSTIRTILRTIRQFSIRHFQYNAIIMENCSSLLLNQLRPFHCYVRCKNLDNDVCLVSMFSDTNIRQVKPLVRLLQPSEVDAPRLSGVDTPKLRYKQFGISNHNEYNYQHLLFVPKHFPIEDLKFVSNKKYVAIINFEDTITDSEHEKCSVLFPRLKFIDADNSINDMSYAYKELMNIYSPNSIPL